MVLLLTWLALASFVMANIWTVATTPPDLDSRRGQLVIFHGIAMGRDSWLHLRTSYGLLRFVHEFVLYDRIDISIAVNSLLVHIVVVGCEVRCLGRILICSQA